MPKITLPTAPVVTTEYVNTVHDDVLIPVYRDVPYTEIENRAQMVDPEKDLGSRFGVERILTQNKISVEGEYGPNGEEVFRVVDNDPNDSIRFVGDWSTFNIAEGVKVTTTTVNDFVEITFYGTGLNLLAYYDSGDRDWRYTLNGGAESANIYDATLSDALNDLSMDTLAVFPLESGLSQGLHTIKLRLADGTVDDLGVYGFEILNETSTIRVSEGSAYVDGKKVSLDTAQTFSYNSGFDIEYGTNTNDGGKVSAYLKNDGTIERVIRWSDATPLYLTNADHTNEEVLKNRTIKEFRSYVENDGFTTDPLSTNVDKVWSLENGEFFQCNSGSWKPNLPLTLAEVSDFIIIGFYGTGLDIIRQDSGTAAQQTIEIFVDGTTQGNLANMTTTNPTKQKICSNLPMGYHVVRINITTDNTDTFGLKSFITYGPKEESVEDAILLHKYFLNADYVVNTTANREAIATGVTRSPSDRGVLYKTGTWTRSTVQDGEILGRDVRSNTNGAIFERTFYADGFEWRWETETGLTTDATIEIDGLVLSETNFTINGTGTGPAVTTSVYGTGIAFNTTTGSLDQSDAGNEQGCGFVISGLGYGLHTLKVTNNAAAYVHVESFDDIIPVLNFEKISKKSTYNPVPQGAEAQYFNFFWDAAGGDGYFALNLLSNADNDLFTAADNTVFAATVFNIKRKGFVYICGTCNTVVDDNIQTYKNGYLMSSNIMRSTTGVISASGYFSVEVGDVVYVSRTDGNDRIGSISVFMRPE